MVARLVACIAASALLVCLPAPAMAAEAPAGPELTVSPVIIDLTLDAGTRREQVVTLANTGGAPMTVTFEHADFGFTAERYDLVFIEDDDPETSEFSTRGWFSVPQRSFVLQPGERREVPLRIDVPPNARSGSHLGAAFFRTVGGTQTQQGGAQVVTSSRAGPLVFVRVTGGADPRPKIARFEGPGLMSDGPMRFTLRMDNEGDSFYSFSGEITVRGPGATQTITVPEKYAMPDMPRTLRYATSEREFPTGRYTVELELDSVPPSEQPLRTTIHVWVIPVWMRIVGILLVLALVALTLVGVTRWRHRRLHRLLTEHDDEGPEDGTAPARAQP